MGSQAYFYSRNQIHSVGKQKMIDLKKKCWREKVTAEITLAHLMHFAREAGNDMTATEIAAFLNRDGRAHGVWMHMMQAGEQYIKASLEASRAGVLTLKQNNTQASMVH
jgi:hypothetical protein